MRLVSITKVTGPNEEDAWYHVNLEKCTRGCTYWKSIGIAFKHAMAVWEMYQSQLKATGEEISQAWHNAARRTRRGICRTARDPGPTCDYYESWFDWDDDNHAVFQDAFQRSL